MKRAPEATTVSRIVGQNIRTLRTRRGWTLEQLADSLAPYRVGPANRVIVCNAEAGRRAVTVDELVHLAAIFGVDPGRLLVVPACTACSDTPPSGYSCLTCGASAVKP